MFLALKNNEKKVYWLDSRIVCSVVFNALRASSFNCSSANACSGLLVAAKARLRYLLASVGCSCVSK